MPSFYLTHTDERGERHEVVGEWLAPSPEAAISRALRVARVEDDGRWRAHPLPSDGARHDRLTLQAIMPPSRPPRRDA